MEFTQAGGKYFSTAQKFQKSIQIVDMFNQDLLLYRSDCLVLKNPQTINKSSVNIKPSPWFTTSFSASVASGVSAEPEVRKQRRRVHGLAYFIISVVVYNSSS